MVETRREKINRYAEELAERNPKKWESCIQSVRTYQGSFSPEEEAKRAKKVFKTWFKPKTGLVPKSEQWNGIPSEHDYRCHKCKLIEEDGVMRYVGSFASGTEKVTREFHDSDGDSRFEDVEFMNYLDGWRCDVCGHEETDGY
jgi:hypothetical protein